MTSGLAATDHSFYLKYETVEEMKIEINLGTPEQLRLDLVDKVVFGTGRCSSGGVEWFDDVSDKQTK